MKRLIKYAFGLAVASVVATALIIAFLPQCKVLEKWGYAFLRAPRETWRSEAELRALIHHAQDIHNPPMEKALSFYKAYRIYRDGKGVPQNTALSQDMCKMALKEFLKVGEKQLEPVKSDNLGDAHTLVFQDESGGKQAAGATMEVNRKRGIERYCINEYSYAQVAAGEILFFGEAGTTNEEQGVLHFSKAAEIGDPAGQFFLGYLYLYGHGVPKNTEIAMRWLRASADSGVDVAQVLIGSQLMFSPQVGDKIDAYKYLNLASAQGNKIAEKQRDDLEKTLTVEQLARAQAMSTIFGQKQSFTGRLSNTNNTANINSRWMSGTCFFINSKGYLVTALHVVENGKQFFVIDESALYVAKLIAKDTTNDLALLQIDGRMTSWNLEDNSGVRMIEEVTQPFKAIPIRVTGVRLGDGVVTIGFPDTQLQGFSPKFTRGDISSLAGASDDPRYFQISVPVQPGNSGGPLLDIGGNVVGVISGQLQPSLAFATAGSLPQNVNYAVKGELIMALVKSVPNLADTLPVLNNATDDIANLTESAVHSVAMILASDASPPFTATILKDKK